VTGKPIHCDLYEVQKGHKVTVTVGIYIVGETPIGVREQGILQQQMHEVELDCLPNAIPASFELDASNLQIGDSLHVSDLTVADGGSLHIGDEAMVVTVIAPKLKDEDEGAEGAEPTTEAEGGDAEEG